MDQIPERDWKYMRGIQSDLLEALADRTNDRSREILSGQAGSSLERYRELYRHILESDDVIANCFDDWRRSNLIIKLLFLRRHGLLPDEHLKQLSKNTQNQIETLTGAP